MTEPHKTRIFDYSRVQRNAERAKLSLKDHAVLIDLVAQSMRNRLGDIKQGFGCPCEFGRFHPLFGAERADWYFYSDLDEELAPCDLFVSTLSLHWLEKIGPFLQKVNASLIDGGAMIISLFGEQTLNELEASLLEAEVQLTGGASQRIAPMQSLSSLGGEMVKANFAMPVVDRESYQLIYPDIWSLMRDLRGMGEGNGLSHIARGSRNLFSLADGIYKKKFPGNGGGIRASFDIVYAHGWKVNRLLAENDAASI